MFAWLAIKTGLSLLGSKILFFGVVSLAIFCALNFTWYRNRLINQGVEEGKAAMAADVESRVTERLAEERKLLAAGHQRLEADRVAVRAEGAENARNRAAVMAMLSGLREQYTYIREADNATVVAIPDADLVRAVRALSAELARTPPAK